MAVPLAPNVLAPVSQHVRRFQSIWFSLQVNASDTSNPIKGYDMLLGSHDGSTSYIRFTRGTGSGNPNALPDITVDPNTWSNKTISELVTAPGAIPQNVGLTVFGRFKNLDGWGPWGSLGTFGSFISTNSVPSGVSASPNNSEVVSIPGTTWNSQFTANFSDSDSDSLIAYQLMVQTSGGGAVSGGTGSMTPFSATAGSNFTVNGPVLSPGSYRWQIRVWDNAGYDDTQAASAYYPASWAYFTVQTTSGGGGPPPGGGNNPPVYDSSFTKSPSGQSTVSGSTYTQQFQTRWTDPEGSAMTGYELTIYQSGSPVYSSGFVGTTINNGSVFSITPPYTHQTNTHYTWTMRVRDNVGNYSSLIGPTEYWGSTGSPTNQTPSCSLVSPSGNVGSTAPTLVGNFSDSGAQFNIFSTYFIQVRQQSNQASFWDTSFTTSNTEKTNKQFQRLYTGNTLVSGTVYEWRAKVRDDGGLDSSWTNWMAFTPLTVAPNAPTITGGTGVQNTLTPTFAGTYSVGAGGVNMAAARIIVYSDSAGTLVLWDTNWFSVSGPNGTAFSRTFGAAGGAPAVPTALVPGQVIYWKAANQDVNGLTGPYSPIQTCSIQSVPAAPINLSPRNSEFYVWSSSGESINPVFAGDHQANTNGNAMNAAAVEVYADYNLTLLVWTSGPVNTTNQTRFRIPYTGSALVRGQKVWWRAQTRDATTNFWGTWTLPQALVINAAPTNATNLIPSGGAAVGNVTPLLSWTPNMGDPIAHTGGAPDGERSVFSRMDIIDTDTNTSMTSGSTDYPIYTADIWDEFTQPSPTSLASHDDGWPATNWNVEGTGTFSASGGRAVATSAPTHLIAYKSSSADGWCGAYVKLDTAVGASCGLLFRRVNANNWWVVTLEGGTSPSIKLKYTTNGNASPRSTVAFTTVAQVNSSDASNPLDVVHGYDNHISVGLNGPAITVYLNGVSVIVATNSTHQSGTGAGLYTHSSTIASIDDFYFAGLTAGDASYQVPAGADLQLNKSYAWNTQTYDGFSMGPISNQAPFTTIEGPTVEITSPTVGETINTPTPTYQWDYDYVAPAGPQATYRIQVLEGTSPVYTSSTIAGTDTTFVQPSGYLMNGHSYRVLVTVTDSNANLAATSSPINFTATWTPPDPILSFDAVGDDANALVTLTWLKSGLAASEFVRYELYRQVGTGDVELIRNITDINTVSFVDYNAPKSDALTYSIRQIKLVGADYIPSGFSSAIATLNLRDMWITDVVEPETYRVRIIDNPSRSFNPTRDEEDVRYWGSQKPVRHIGIGLFTNFNVSGMLFGPDSLTNPTEDHTPYLAILEEMLERKNIVCYRDGRGRKFFANFSYQVTDQLPHMWQVSVTFVETEYTEGQ